MLPILFAPSLFLKRKEHNNFGATVLRDGESAENIAVSCRLAKLRYSYSEMQEYFGLWRTHGIYQHLEPVGESCVALLA